jgi:hypothetical protein
MQCFDKFLKIAPVELSFFSNTMEDHKNKYNSGEVVPTCFVGESAAALAMIMQNFIKYLPSNNGTSRHLFTLILTIL